MVDSRTMEVKHCRAQHEVLVTLIRDTLHFWGSGDQLRSSQWIECAAVKRADDPSSPIPATSELKSVLTRARVLLEECCRPLPPLKAALLHAKRSQAFTDIVREIQWCVAVVLHGSRACRNEEHCAKHKEFPWDAEVGDQDQVLLRRAEQEDWRNLMAELRSWERDHECSSERRGNVDGREDPRFCLATQLLRHYDGSEHLSMLWSFEKEVLIHGGPLGSGSFAAVTKATWMGNTYALKTFRSNLVGRTSLRGEVEALAKLNHPHIVKMYACSEDSLLLDLMSLDLHKFMRERMQMQGGARTEPFSLPAAIDLMLQIADVVSYLHSQGMVHRDLKSSNILVDDLEDGFVFAKVADFGLAKEKHEMTLYSHCSHNVGTRRWMTTVLFGASKKDKHLEHAYPMMFTALGSYALRFYHLRNLIVICRRSN